MLPICSSPSAMRWAPNHTIATLAPLMISIMLGNVSANSRVTASVVAVEVGVGLGEACLLVTGAHERAHHPDAGEVLAQHPVQTVDLELHRAEERHGTPQHEPDDHEHQRHDDEQQTRQPHVLAQRHDHAADHRDRRGHEEEQAHDDERLHLLDVVGGARDQRRRPEVVDLAQREALHPAEERGPHVAAHAMAVEAPR